MSDSRLAPARLLRVLVLDDDPSLAEVLGEFLRMLGHQPTLCYSGTDALGRLEKEPFDLVFSDYRMPEMDGQQFYRAALQMQPGLAGRIVFVTGDTSTDNTQLFIRSTEARQLAKPFRFSEVQRILTDLREGL